MKQNVSSPLTRKNSILWGASATDRERSLPQTTRARISNHVSGAQCHIIHIIILRRFNWPSSAYMCTQMTLKITFISFIIISFIHFTIQNEIFTTSTTRLTCWLACWQRFEHTAVFDGAFISFWRHPSSQADYLGVFQSRLTSLHCKIDSYPVHRGLIIYLILMYQAGVVWG